MTATRRYFGCGALAASLLFGGLSVARAATELSFWSWRQEDRAFYEEQIKKFQAANPDITVTFQPYQAENYQTILSTALAGGKGPDVMMVRAYGNLESVASPGYLMALDPKDVPELANFPEPTIKGESLRADGKVYAVPFAPQTMLVVYNKKIFADNGVKVPTTWDEMMTLSKTLKDKRITPFGNGMATAWQNEAVFGALMSSTLGKSFEDDLQSGKADFTDPRFVKALANLKDISQYFAPNFIGVDYPSAQQLFASGRAAMFAGGTFEIPTFKGLNSALDLGVFAAPGPSGSEPLVARYNDGGYAINAKTDKKAAAVKFIRFLASPEFGTASTASLKALSPIKGVSVTDPVTNDIAKLVDKSMSYLFLVYFRYQEPSGSVLAQAAIQKLFAGVDTPEQAGAEITKGIATYYKPFQK